MNILDIIAKNKCYFCTHPWVTYSYNKPKIHCPKVVNYSSNGQRYYKTMSPSTVYKAEDCTDGHLVAKWTITPYIPYYGRQRNKNDIYLQHDLMYTSIMNIGNII